MTRVHNSDNIKVKQLLLKHLQRGNSGIGGEVCFLSQWLGFQL